MNLLHFFIPHQKNNHRAKILHHASLVSLIIFFSVLSSTAILVHKTHPEVLGVSYQISDTELLNLTNYERSQNGLPPLSLDSKLTQAAKLKAAHMFKNNYWAHFAPDGTSPWDFIRKVGYDYSYAGENLAKGYTTSTDAVTAWMNSPTHRANILSPQFNDVGFAISEGELQGEDTVLIVQMFGSKENSIVNNNKALIQNGVNATEKIPDNGSLNNVKGSSQIEIPSGAATLTTELKSHPLLNLVSGSKAITFAILSIILISLILDFIIIKKKRIPRRVGNNLDHIILISLFIVFIFVAKFGNII